MRLIALVLLALDFSPILASDTDAALALATARRSRIAAAQQAPQTAPVAAPATFYLVNGQWIPEAQFEATGNPFGVTGSGFGATTQGGSCAGGQCSPATGSYQRRGFFRR